MRKFLVVTALILAVLLVGCSDNGNGDTPLNLDLDSGETAVSADATAVGAPVAVPQVPPTPTLPATYTPPARLLGEHLYLLPVAGEAGKTAVHIVQNGETLAMISQHYFLSPDLLAQANQLQVTDKLATGTVLVIPTPAP